MGANEATQMCLRVEDGSHRVNAARVIYGVENLPTPEPAIQSVYLDRS